MALLVLLLGFVSSACNVRLPGIRMSCEQIADDTLRSVPFDALSSKLIRQWITDNYQVREADIARFDYDDEKITESFYWKWRNKEYSAAFHDEDLRNIAVGWMALRPTGNEILGCLGQPDFYTAFYRPAGEPGNLLQLELWYLDEGIVVHHARFGRSEQPPMIHGNLTMNDMTVVRPGNAGQVVADVYLPRSEEVKRETAQAMKPWPGTWEDIVVETTVFP